MTRDLPMSDPEYLTTRQAAQRLGVSLGTVQHMVESGVLEAWKTVGGHRRIPVTALEAYMGRRMNTGAGGEGAQALDVLIAEDDLALQALYRATMERWDIPMNLRLVSNGFDGLLQVGQRSPDVLIADLTMPGMDGFEMIRHLREKPELDQMDIVVVSAIAAEDMAGRNTLPPDVIVFPKPIPFHEIKGFFRARLTAKQRKGF